ncbi:MAG: hypothetical protein J7K26_01980 [Candidatus Aenigmarchaeota archaeon]|nr:hypothetical protein [Candidatus Aenigmarchaeota archaeon]
MKGLEPLIGAVLVIVITISAIALIIQISKPSIDRQKEIIIFDSAKNIMKSIDNSIKDVSSEAQGSSRKIKIDIVEGVLLIKDNKIVYNLDSPSQIIGKDIIQQENNLRIIGLDKKISMELYYDNIDIIGNYEIWSDSELIIRNSGISAGKTQIEIIAQ